MDSPPAFAHSSPRCWRDAEMPIEPGAFGETSRELCEGRPEVVVRLGCPCDTRSRAYRLFAVVSEVAFDGDPEQVRHDAVGIRSELDIRVGGFEIVL
jgi:hypothetical protein